MTVYDVARRLPAIADLRDLCRSLAMLDAILSPEWESRYHSFAADWAEGEEMASMRDGSGDDYSIVFSAARAYMRGFGHESPMSPYGHDGAPWPGVIDDVPEVFKPFAEDYYEVSVDLGAVRDLYALRPLDQELVSLLNVEVTLADLAEDISGIGYPQAR
ncbi:hypothetical protein [Streptomyces liangshanensis]|uniref:hypothetical protein n=1 Tax=Streptomyces liangshanensis TaxID=2717324 RepID=UPI0036DE9FF0